MTITTVSCTREAEVLNLVTIGQWPGRADEALRAHVRDCSICCELATIAAAIRSLEESSPRVRVPDASIVWHTAARRARNDAQRRATLPMSIVQGLAVAGGAGAGLVALATGVIRWPSGDTPSVLTRWMSGAPTAADMAVAAGLIFVAALVPVAASLAALADRETDTSSGHR